MHFNQELPIVMLPVMELAQCWLTNFQIGQKCYWLCIMYIVGNRRRNQYSHIEKEVHFWSELLYCLLMGCCFTLITETTTTIKERKDIPSHV